MTDITDDKEVRKRIEKLKIAVQIMALSDETRYKHKSAKEIYMKHLLPLAERMDNYIDNGRDYDGF